MTRHVPAATAKVMGPTSNMPRLGQQEHARLIKYAVLVALALTLVVSARWDHVDGAGGALGVAEDSSVGSDVLYTTDAEFDQGTLVNVNHDAPGNNQLQLNAVTRTFPFIWVSLSQRCTIAKISTETGAILGEYRTIADGVVCNESSRTTVALDGSVWVGHRGPGGVTHVGLFELNQCVDRNGNGTIETAIGYGDVKAWPGATSLVANAVDECIIHHVDTDSAPISLGDSRHVSIDANNNLWVGGWSGGHRFIRVNGTTGAVETAVRSFSCGGYGGLIDGNGVIWSANGGSNGLLRWDPSADDSATNPRCLNIPVYGLAIDPGGFVWAGALYNNEVRKVSPDGNSVGGPFGHGSSNAQGLAADSQGDIWVSSSLFCGTGCTIGHLKNDGTFVGNVPNPTGAGSTGVSIDAAGKPWTTNLNSNTATRIDPSLGPIGADGITPIGQVDLSISFPSSPCPSPRASVKNCTPYPYNYSDMTGAQLLNTTAPQGTWTITQDSGSTGTQWGTITWNTEPEGRVPPGATIRVEARAAETVAGIGGETLVEVLNGTPFSLTGRFVQVRVTLRPGAGNASPTLSDIRISSAGCGAEGAPCDDGDACTTNDACSGGACLGSATDCSDQNPCTDDTCNAITGCVHTDNTSPCDDGNACTTGDTCASGACQSGSPVSCSALDQCHLAGTCNPATGQCSSPPRLDGSPCDDGIGCTVDSCVGGVCVGRDVMPPVITGIVANPAFLWPPNHSLRNVEVGYAATDNCSSSACRLTVTSNEPENGTGDGDTSPDWIVVDDHHAQIRAERAGIGKGRTYTVIINCLDGSGNPATANATVIVKHDMSSPKSGAAFRLGSSVNFEGSFWDVPGRSHTAQWLFDGLVSAGSVVESTATKSGSVKGAYTFTATGVYAVKMNVKDASGATGTADTVDGVNALVVVYDPNGGYVTGGGWLDSPPGAFVASPSVTGKVNFGFVSKYFRNATNPKGETEFDFRLANFKFNALNFDYLMISGAKAMYKGFGKVNGDAGYNFILTILDGQATGGGGVDKFRMKIWNKSTGAIIYDNQMGAPDNADPTALVGSGSGIVIQP